MPPSMRLRFSILTPTLNRRAMVAEAAESVAAQGWPALEHIVADGGSSDGTREWLAGRAGVRVLPGGDEGIYDGLNKAVAAAEGDIIGWLNSDDCYAPGAFAAVSAAFARDPSLHAVCGGARIEADGRIERIYEGALVADLSPGALLIGPTLPNAWFFRREIVTAVGKFSTALRYAADSDFMMRFARLRPRCTFINALFYRYRRHEGSATISRVASTALRRDMLALAQMWSSEGFARPTARALEGRCRAALAYTAMLEGDLREVAIQARHFGTIAQGFSDLVRRSLDPPLRRRRRGKQA